MLAGWFSRARDRDAETTLAGRRPIKVVLRITEPGGRRSPSDGGGIAGLSGFLTLIQSPLGGAIGDILLPTWQLRQTASTLLEDPPDASDATGR
jgi:hypothetical protein